MNIRSDLSKELGCYKLMAARIELEDLFYYMDLDDNEKKIIWDLCNSMLDEESLYNGRDFAVNVK